jgi:hypothetical protein
MPNIASQVFRCSTANKIAAIYCKKVRNKEEFIPVDLKDYQQQYTPAKIAFLERKLSQLQREVA